MKSTRLDDVRMFSIVISWNIYRTTLQEFIDLRNHQVRIKGKNMVKWIRCV